MNFVVGNTEGGNLDLVGSIMVGKNNATFKPWSLHQHSIWHFTSVTKVGWNQHKPV